jgi:hypothetical protein
MAHCTTRVTHSKFSLRQSSVLIKANHISHRIIVLLHTHTLTTRLIPTKLNLTIFFHTQPENTLTVLQYMLLLLTTSSVFITRYDTCFQLLMTTMKYISAPLTHCPCYSSTLSFSLKIPQNIFLPIPHNKFLPLLISLYNSITADCHMPLISINKWCHFLWFTPTISLHLY